MFKVSYLPPLIFLFFAVLTCASCGTYRTGSGSYRGMGTLRPPSDYAESPEPSGQIDEAESVDARQKLSERSQYVPRYAFKLFWPVSQVRVNRGFHPPEDPSHSGIDLGGKRGSPILAAHEGVVIYIGQNFRGYGKMILVEYDDEWATLYSHLDDFNVTENTIVMPGDQIGTMGSTGRATGVHLHFEVMHNRQPMDPLQLLTRPTNFADKKSKRRRTLKRTSREKAL